METPRISAFVVAAFAAGLLFQDDGQAHQGQIVYPVYEPPSSEFPDLHDQTLEDRAQERPWADVGAFESGEGPTQSILEIALTPWDDLNIDGPEVSRRSVLESGRIIGFNISVVDFGIGNAPDGFFSQAPMKLSARVADGSFTHNGFTGNAVDAELTGCQKCANGQTGRRLLRVQRDEFFEVVAAVATPVLVEWHDT